MRTQTKTDNQAPTNNKLVADISNGGSSMSDNSKVHWEKFDADPAYRKKVKSALTKNLRRAVAKLKEFQEINCFCGDCDKVKKCVKTDETPDEHSHWECLDCGNSHLALNPGYNPELDVKEKQ